MHPDDDAPAQEPSLFRELVDGTAGVGARIVVALAAGVFLAGAAMMAIYLLAATVRSWDRRAYYGSDAGPGVYPRDELIITMLVLAGVAWVASIVWLFLPRSRRRVLGMPALQTLGIVIVAICLGVLAGSLHGESELLVAGIIMLAVASVIVLWLQAIRRARRGRPFTHRVDLRPDIRCPECGYRMVGLHESRCPECGTQYTLDDLLARQDFARRVPTARGETTPMPPPVPVTPPPPPLNAPAATT